MNINGKSNPKAGTTIRGERTMTRIIVTPASSGNDLSQRFVKAVNLLNENGIKLYSGTKLVSRYAVIVAEDPSKALEHLRAGNISAFVEQ